MLQFKPYPHTDGIYVIESFGKFVVPTFLATYYDEIIKLFPAVKGLFDPKFQSVAIFEGWRNSLFKNYPDFVMFDSSTKDTTPYTIDDSERVQIICKGNPIFTLPSITETLDELDFIIDDETEFTGTPYFYDWLRVMVTERFFYQKLYK